ncbi:MAG: ATP-dependent DNA ligase [Nocardioides sp.]
MLLDQVSATSAAVASTRSRRTKVALLATALGAADPTELPVVATWLSGSLPQRRTGIGWRSLRTLPESASRPTLTVTEVDDAFERMAELSGPGSSGRRADLVTALLSAATESEQDWLRGVITGEVRQGALAALLTEAIATAADVPVAVVRRAVMLTGSPAEVAPIAFADGADGLLAIGIRVGRPVLPMLASSASDVAAAVATAGEQLGPAPAGPVIVEAKLDGIRIQVHRRGDEVVVATRSLDVITDRLPEVVAFARSLPATSFVLDGEAILVDAQDRARPFQETASRAARRAGGTLTPYFFDVLHLDGTDLLDEPGSARLAVLDRLVPEAHRVARLVTADPVAAQDFADAVLSGGHEGVVVKSPGATYAAGRRGAAWIKVKPVHTLDLVVLAVEEGSGRRRGRLSNIHLGARDPEHRDGSVDGFVMLGKTFKGMTDAMLAWQTERFTELMTTRDEHVVRVRPEQVVEIAFDGLQRSTRYPGGVALRFARVVRYRDDKTADEADTIDTVLALAR